MKTRRMFLGGAAAAVVGCRYRPLVLDGEAPADTSSPATTDSGDPSDSGGPVDTAGSLPDDSAPPEDTSADDTGGTPTSCTTTSTGAIGPNYLPNVPERTELVPASTGGTRLEVSGTVRDLRCQPVADHPFEVWQATIDGGYDFSDELLYRGTVRTDASGAYRFVTRVPGYELGPDGDAIPLHIHFNSSARGAYGSLVTLFYFQGDEVLAAFDPPTDLVCAVIPDGSGGQKMTFDVVLPDA